MNFNVVDIKDASLLLSRLHVIVTGQVKIIQQENRTVAKHGYCFPIIKYLLIAFFRVNPVYRLLAPF